MAIRLTKTSKILFAIGIIVLSVALGFLIWRVNQEAQLDPGDSDASQCADGCYDNQHKDGCVGINGCDFATGGSCPSGYELITSKVDDRTQMCCHICTSTAAPVKCELYPNGVPNNKYKASGVPITQPGYYECDSAGYCIPCTPTTSETIQEWQECQDEADGLNGNLVSYCPAGEYKWSCQQLADGSGYILKQIPCVDTSDGEEPTVDCSYDLEPTTYSFNKANTDSSKIGPFTEDGKLVLFFKNLLPDNNAAYRPQVTFKVVSSDSSRNNQTHVYTPTSSEERKETTFAVKKGEYLLLTDSDDKYDQGSPECAPTTNNPKYKSFGWIAPSSGLCGSGLLGPPTNGTRTAYDKVNISSFRSTALTQGYKQLPKGEQCWADWREWAGDYDFNDYFLMVSYVTDTPTQTANMSVTKVAVESCTGEDTENPIAQLTYSVTITNSGGAAGTVSKVEDVLDSKVKAGSVSAISGTGQYSDGKITWNFVPAESISAGGTKVLTYKVAVDKADFGSYQNLVSVVTSQGTVTDQATITADCIITETPEEPETPVTPTEGTVPQTGLFDSTASRIVAGFVLLTFGAVIYNLPNSTFTMHSKGKSYKYRDRFEKRVANR